MGVRGLTALLQKLAPSAVTTQNISHYKGKTLAVDASCYLNRFIYGLDPHPARVQRGIYRLCVYLQLHGIKPVFVFDGPGRIIEKQREAQRRRILKEKAERSFQLEKVRKSRLKGLQGSTELLHGMSTEQIASILEDIQLQDNTVLHPGIPSPEVIVTTDTPTGIRTASEANVELESDKAPTVVSTDPTVTPTAREANVSDKAPRVISTDLDHAPISYMDPFTDKLHPMDLIFNLQEDMLESEPVWSMSSLSEKDMGKLEDHLEGSKDLDLSCSRLLRLSDMDFGESFGILERELDALDPLEEMEPLDEFEAFYDFSSTIKPDGDPGRFSGLMTGVSFQRTIPPHELIWPQAPDQLDPSNDAMIRKRVHEAMNKFVQSIEGSLDGSLGDLEENATRRQKELNQLEVDLVQGIKETSRINRKKRATPVEHLEREAESEKGTTDTQGLGLVDADVFKSKDEQPLDITAGETEPKRHLAAGDEDLSHQLPLSDTPESTQDLPFVESVVETVEAQIPGELEVEGEAEDEDESKQDRDLQSMIHGVLSAHRSALAVLERRTLRVTWPLKAMGQPVVQADDAEAEAVCARLTTLGWTDASVSEDTDTAVFGNGLLLRQVGTDKGIIEINPLAAHASLELNRDAFRDMCILCGTDFSGTIEGIGSLRAAKLMQRYGSIESIMANVERKPREDFVYDRARRVFDRIPTLPENQEACQSRPENQPLLRKLMSKYEIVHDEVVKELLAEENASTMTDKPFEASSLGADPFQATMISIPAQDGSRQGLLQ
ncbi:Flap endonuclease GEN 1 [Mortierella sp. GBA43]|nr:Flap endonuclease GEN 1 [Mortierella sp. GBA43]